MEKLAIVILAAGKSSRMGVDLKKELMETRRGPLLSLVLDTAKALTPEKIVLVTGHQKEKVAALAEKWAETHSQKIDICVQEQLKGTGDAVKSASAALKGFVGTVVLLCGDVPRITPQTLRALVLKHEQKRATVSLVSFNAELPNGYGKIVRDEKGKTLRIVETRDANPEEALITESNSGIYAVDSAFLWKALEKLTPTNAQGEYYFTDIVGLAAKEGQNIEVILTPNSSEVLGVNTRSELAAIERLFEKEAIAALQNKGVRFIDPHSVFLDASVTIETGAAIGPQVQLRGKTSIAAEVVIDGSAVLTNCVVAKGAHIKFGVVAEDSSIGEDTAVGPFAHLRPGSQLGAGSKVGNFVETKKAILGPGVKASHLTYLGDCEIGENTNIGAGTVTCNYDGYNKHRTVVGNNVFIGSDTSIVAPVTIGDGAMIAAGSVITKDVQSDALAISRSQQVEKAGWARGFRKTKGAA